MIGEALAKRDFKRLSWCNEYVDMIRGIELKKFDEICAFILEYIDKYTRLTPEEIKKLKESNKSRSKGDISVKEKLDEKFETKDLMFYVWGNVTQKSVMHKKIEFNRYESAMPM